MGVGVLGQHLGCRGSEPGKSPEDPGATNVGQRKSRSQGEGLRPDLKGRVRSDLCSVKVLLAALVNRFVWLDAGKGGPGWLWDKREVDGFNRSLGSMLKGLRGGRRWRGVNSWVLDSSH